MKALKRADSGNEHAAPEPLCGTPGSGPIGHAPPDAGPDAAPSHTSPRGNASSFLKNSAWLIVVEMASKCFGLLFFIFLARFLGAPNLGLYSFALTLANGFALIPRFGFERLVQKEVGRHSTVSTLYLAEICLIKLILSLAALGLLYLTVLTAGIQEVAVILVVSGFVFFFAFLEFLNALFRGLKRAEYEVLVRTLFSVVNLCAGLLLLQHGKGLLHVAAAQLGAAILAVCLALILLRRFLVRSPFQWNRQRFTRHLAAAAPFGGILVTLYAGNQMGVLILSLFQNETEIGYFAASMRIFENLTLIGAAVMGAFLPAMSELYVKSLESFRRTLHFTMKHFFVLGAPMATGLILLADPIIGLVYGTDFAPSALNLRILAPALIFSFWNYTADSVLIAVDAERRLFVLTSAGAVVHVTANLLLVPFWSHQGAAWAVVVTQGVYFLLLLVRIRSYLGYAALLHLMGRPTLCTLLMGGSIYLLKDQPLWLVIPLGGAIYGAAVLLSGTVRVREIRGFQEMLRRGDCTKS